MDSQCDEFTIKPCQEKMFWCGNVTSGEELAWRDTFVNAVKRCALLGASILTLNATTTRQLLKGESAWTGSRRFNEYVFFSFFIHSTTLF